MKVNSEIDCVQSWLEQCEVASQLTSLTMTGNKSYISGYYSTAFELQKEHVRKPVYVVGREKKIHTRMGDVYQVKLLATLYFYAPYLA